MVSTTRRVLGNGFWGAGQQAVAVGLNSVIGVVLVVFVSVNDYGIYSYAVALASLGNTIMTAGLNSLAVKDLVNNREANASIVAGLMVVREFFALLGFVAAGAIALTSADGALILATLISSAALFTRAIDAPESWFLSHLRSSQTASARIVVAVVMFGVRLLLLFIWADVWMLLALAAVESLAASVWIIVRYLRAPDSPGLTRPAIREVFGLARRSWPLLLSGVANQINLRGGLLVIQAVLGTPAVAVYAAASKLSEVTYLLPVVFMNSTLPVLLEVRKAEGSESPRYERMLQRSYDQAFWLGVAVAVGIATVGVAIIHLLFGDAYNDAADVLLIQVISCPFVFMAAVYSKWIVAEGYLWSSLSRHVAGAVLNLGLTFLLIGPYGLAGAAVASVVSYIGASYLAAFLGRRSRFAARQMTLAILAPLRLVLGFYRRRRNA
jgi:O-antigen/teichoic acid export membrane protein